MENLMLIAYLVYLPVTLGLTFYVANKLFTHSKVFMMDIFHGRQEIAEATNSLFKIGFYLLNIGAALYIVEMYTMSSYQRMVEILGEKIGGFSIYLGVTLFACMFLFFRGKKKAGETVLNAKKS